MKKFYIVFLFIISFIFISNYLIGQDQKASDSTSGTGEFIPIGSVISFPGSTIPLGWLLAYGQEIDQVTYANLYAVIGSTYCTNNHGLGGACSSGKFRLPDLRGRVIAGKDNMGNSEALRIRSDAIIDGSLLGSAGGLESFKLTNNNLSTHTHPFGTFIASTSRNTVKPGGTTDTSHSHSISITSNIIPFVVSLFIHKF